MSALDADTTTLLSGISSGLHTASTWITGPRSQLLAGYAGQLDDLLAGKSATDILGGTVAAQVDPAAQNAPPPDDVPVTTVQDAPPADQPDSARPANVAPPAVS